MNKRITKSYSIDTLTKKKFKTLEISRLWEQTIGLPEDTGVWLVWGASGNGKSRFLMQLSQELCKFGKVVYNSLEEGSGLSAIKNVVESGLSEDKYCRRNFSLLDRVSLPELKERLRKQRPPKFVIIDSLQYWSINKNEYKLLKEEFNKTLFIFNSHADGKEPHGNTAKFIRYDADVKIRIEGFKAFPVSRYGGGMPYVIWEDGAAKYWMDLN